MKDIEAETKKLYIKLQNEAGFKPGDKVKVLRAATDFEYGWNEIWIPQKDKYVGNTYTIYAITKTGVQFEESDSKWHFPYFILEKVEQTYRIGQRFLYEDIYEYILVCVANNTINLINLQSGGRWSDNTRVKNIKKITIAEMKALTNSLGQWKGFKPLGE